MECPYSAVDNFEVFAWIINAIVEISDELNIQKLLQTEERERELQRIIVHGNKQGKTKHINFKRYWWPFSTSLKPPSQWIMLTNDANCQTTVVNHLAFSLKEKELWRKNQYQSNWKRHNGIAGKVRDLAIGGDQRKWKTSLAIGSKIRGFRFCQCNNTAQLETNILS